PLRARHRRVPGRALSGGRHGTPGKRTAGSPPCRHPGRSQRTAPMNTNSHSRAVARVIAELQPLLGDRISTATGTCRQHGRGEGYPAIHPPDAVAWPESTAEVSRILAACHARGVPVVAFGAGTSLEGHVTAPHGGICLDMSRMDRLLAVHAEDADCVVQPGVTREALNSALRDTG